MDKYYTLVKMSIKDDHVSAVSVGRVFRGTELKTRSHRVIYTTKLSPEGIKLDDEVIVSGEGDFVKTSPVQKIEVNKDGVYILTTKTSVYHLLTEDKKEE